MSKLCCAIQPLSKSVTLILLGLVSWFFCQEYGKY